MVGVVVLSVLFFKYCSTTTIRSFLPTCCQHVGCSSNTTRHHMVCMWQHNPYVADMIFCVADTVDDMSLYRVDWAPTKKRHNTDISSQGCHVHRHRASCPLRRHPPLPFQSINRPFSLSWLLLLLLSTDEGAIARHHTVPHSMTRLTLSTSNGVQDALAMSHPRTPDMIWNKLFQSGKGIVGVD
jgi:hypothetical protein